MNVEELANEILISRRITRADQQQLMSALLSRESLEEEERTLIDRVFYGVRHGLVRVVD